MLPTQTTMLTVLDRYTAALILRTHGPVLLVGRAARECLRASGVSLVTRRPDTAICLLGVLTDSAAKLPAVASEGLATTHIGRHWYLVNETDVRDAYGAGAIDPDRQLAGVEATLLPGRTTVSEIDRPRLGRHYFEDAD